MLLVCQTALSFPHDDKRVNSISPFAHYKYFLPMSCELGAQMNPIHLLHPGASSAFYYNSRNNFQVSFCLPRSPGRNKHVLPYLRPVSSCWVATGDGNCYSKGDLQGSCFYFKQIAVCILGVVRRFWYVICNPVLSPGFMSQQVINGWVVPCSHLGANDNTIAWYLLDVLSKAFHLLIWRKIIEH